MAVDERPPGVGLGLLYAGVLIALAASGVSPFDRATWFMEVAPIFVAFPLMWLTRARFRLSTLLYLLIALHALILIAGGAYTYARVPLGFRVQEWLIGLLGITRPMSCGSASRYVVICVKIVPNDP